MLVDPQDLERIAKQALRELGAGDVDVVVEPEAGSDRWRITARGQSPASFVIRCGRGTTAQFVRTQIFEKFQRH
jgi:hypothetical protein